MKPAITETLAAATIALLAEAIAAVLIISCIAVWAGIATGGI